MIQNRQEEIVKIQSRGLLTIPAKFRKKPYFEENSLVRIIKEKGRLIIEPVRTLPYPVRSYTKQELKEFFELDKKETNELKNEGLI
ncbi:MAG: AbrB/MazE/SpoVT family DNA-binding domain-containing protein [Actinobacteria bacterium]|nr:AbrB/MazE/SpoVT family DNA-binding domain-containing protein [Actinomycetota bacterium]